MRLGAMISKRVCALHSSRSQGVRSEPRRHGGCGWVYCVGPIRGPIAVVRPLLHQRAPLSLSATTRLMVGSSSMFWLAEIAISITFAQLIKRRHIGSEPLQPLE